MFRASRFLALALLLILPSALAGTAASPEVRDVANDAPAPLDIVSTWVTNDASSVTFHVKVSDLSQDNPILGSDGDRYYYRVEFGLSTSTDTWFAEGLLSIAYVPPTAGLTGEGSHGGAGGVFIGSGYNGGDTQVQGSTTSGSVSVDAASGVVSITVTRNSAIPLSTGAIITGLKVSTYSGSDAYEINSAVLQPMVGGGRTLADSAGPGLNYAIA